MKKISILMASLAIAASSFAQGEAEPNRLIVTNSIGNTKGYVLDRVQDLSFARVDGEVKANVELFSATCEELSLAVTKTEDCSSYKLDILPSVVADRYDDLTVISYINYTDHEIYYDDFTNATLSGIELQPSTDYVLVTIGIDRYGVEDGVVRVPFTTPSPEIAGSPEIQTEIVDRQLTSFSIKFTPNDDVMEYYCVAGEKGTLMSQYEFFGPMMGLVSFTDMIIKWGGIAHYEEDVIEWTQMAPNTEYEVYYVALDMNGNPAEYQCVEVSTLSLGGNGEAKVDIQIGKYEYADWGGEILPSQYITFTPNEESSCYRFGVYLAERYDPLADEIKADLKTDPEMPTAYWFFYDPMTTDFQINPDTECVAIAAAKNGDGEWGEVTEVRFTTPSEAAGNPAGISSKKTGKVINNRFADKKSTFKHEAGKAPVFTNKKRMQLK